MINDLMALHRMDEAEKDDKQVKLPVITVGPLGSAIPDDGILEYFTFDGLADFIKHANSPTSVVLVRNDQIGFLSAFCGARAKLGYEVNAVYGLPAVEYSPAFDEAIFGVARISYSPLISEMNIAIDVLTMQERNREKSDIEKEESRFIRKSGKIKEVDSDDIAVGDEEDDDEQS